MSSNSYLNSVWQKEFQNWQYKNNQIESPLAGINEYLDKDYEQKFDVAITNKDIFERKVPIEEAEIERDEKWQSNDCNGIIFKDSLPKIPEGKQYCVFKIEDDEYEGIHCTIHRWLKTEDCEKDCETECYVHHCLLDNRISDGNDQKFGWFNDGKKPRKPKFVYKGEGKNGQKAFESFHSCIAELDEYCFDWGSKFP